MPDPQACCINLTTDFEMVGSEDGKTDFLAVKLSVAGEELETLIVPLEESNDNPSTQLPEHDHV